MWVGHVLAGEVPDHGAELVVHVEAQPVVDAPQPSVRRRTGRGRSCGRRCWRPRRRRSMTCELVLVAPVLEQCEVVLLVVGGDEQLHRTGPERGVVAEQGRRHHTPAEGFGQVVGGDLAPVEPVGEVPQGLLAAVGLVDGLPGSTRPSSSWASRCRVCLLPRDVPSRQTRKVRLELHGSRPSTTSSQVASSSAASSRDGPTPGRHPLTRPVDGGRWSGGIRVRRGPAVSRTAGRGDVPTRRDGRPGW